MSPTQIAGPQGFGPPSTTLLSHKQGAGLEAGLLVLEPASKWDIGACKARTSTARPTQRAQQMFFEDLVGVLCCSGALNTTLSRIVKSSHRQSSSLNSCECAFVLVKVLLRD